MHVFIIPPEEFVPPRNHFLGIFQYHQACILQNAGYKVGVLSVTQAYSIPMLAKSILFKLIGKRTGNSTDNMSLKQVLSLSYNKLFNQDKFIQEERVGEINVFRVEGFYYAAPSDYTNSYGWVKAGLAAFKKYVAKYGMPDVVHAHNAMYSGILAQAIKSIYKVPYVITEHSTWHARGLINDRRLHNLLHRAYLRSDGVYAVSKPFCELLATKFGGVTFNYFPNVLDPFLEAYEYVPATKSTTNDFVFLNIAELHPKKNHKLLIEAFAALKKQSKYAHARLWLAGSGSEYDTIKAQIDNLQLQKDVIMHGLLSRQRILEAIQQSDSIVLSSDYETFGVVLIEGMLFGKPVIATKCGGPESFVNDTCGILIETGNVEQLADAMAWQMDNQDVYSATSIRNYALDQFGAASFLRKINEIYPN